MATPQSGVEGILSQPSPDPWISALLVGTQWAAGSLTYSFVGPGSTFSTQSVFGYAPGTEPWSPRLSYFLASAQDAAASALSKWSDVANLSFTPVADMQDSCGDLRFAFSDIGSALAEAFSPAVGAGGDVWFSYTERLKSFAPGSYDYLALLHEIGHALGLKHPFSASSGNAAVLPATLDSQSFTVMSYSARLGDMNTGFSYRPTTPMVGDIRAMQYLYGANTAYHAGDTLYQFTQDGDYHQTIWDGGGQDTIAYDGSDACVIDLRPEAGSVLGRPVYLLDAFGARLGVVHNVWIASGVAIENATGGGGDDRLVGNELANVLVGGAGDDILVGSGGDDRLEGGGGDDRLVGGTGDDVAVFAGPSGDYTITYQAATGLYAVGDRLRERDGIDLVSQAELFEFSDGPKSAQDLALAAPVTGDAFAIIAISEGFFGLGPGEPQFMQALAMVESDGPSRLASALAGSFSGVESGALAATVLTNLGIRPATLASADPDATFDALHTAVAGVLDSHSDERGQVVLNICGLLAGLESDATYGQAAAGFQNMVAGDLNVILVAAGGPLPGLDPWG